MNYGTPDQELYAIVYSFKQWRHYLEGSEHTIEVLSDHANLQAFMKQQKINGRQARWCMTLLPFDFVIKHRAGKTNPADAPSRLFGKSEDAQDPSLLTSLQSRITTDSVMNQEVRTKQGIYASDLIRQKVKVQGVTLKLWDNLTSNHQSHININSIRSENSPDIWDISSQHDLMAEIRRIQSTDPFTIRRAKTIKEGQLIELDQGIMRYPLISNLAESNGGSDKMSPPLGRYRQAKQKLGFPAVRQAKQKLGFLTIKQAKQKLGFPAAKLKKQRLGYPAARQKLGCPTARRKLGKSKSNVSSKRARNATELSPIAKSSK